MDNNKNNKKESGNTDSGDGKSKKPFPKKDYKKPSTNKKEGSDKVIEKRNNLLIKFFSLINLPVRIIGDDSSPDMVYNEEVLLNAYVNNFELIFTDSPTSKKAVYTVVLNDNPRFDKNRILKCLSDYKTRIIYKVALKTSPKLYLAGYNFLNKVEKSGRYPVFSSYNPKIYFTEEKANEIVNELNTDGYEAVCE